MATNRPTDQEIRELFTSQNARHIEVTAAIAGENLTGYPVGRLNIMEHSQLNRLAALTGMKDPDYVSNPVAVYAAACRAVGAQFSDQWIPYNPLTMRERGYVDTEKQASTGAEEIVVDGMRIEEPEDVVEHMEKFVFPRLEQKIADFDHEARVREIGLSEYDQQMEIGLDMIKTGYGYIHFPKMAYTTYGYVNYFCAYALYEDVMAKHFKLQAELAYKNNQAAAEAVKRYNLPLLFRLDHDMTDSRSTLVDIRSMEKIWFPQLAYCLEPIHKGCDTRLIWHCDGNIMPMIPGLIDAGVRGFQGFQYEDGVDFKKLAKLRDRDGRPIFLWAGVSVTRELPFGTPADVRRQIDFFVENHGDCPMVFGCSSSVAPGVPGENIDAMIEGFRYYRNRKK